MYKLNGYIYSHGALPRTLLTFLPWCKKVSKKHLTCPSDTLSYRRGKKGTRNKVFDCARFAQKISRLQAENF